MISDWEEISNQTTLPARSLDVDFALVLSRVIGSIQEDPRELRMAVYDLARIKLQREAWRRDPPMTHHETRQLLSALEAAIERVETVSSKHEELRALQSLDRLIESSQIGASPTTIESPESFHVLDGAVQRQLNVPHVQLDGPSVVRRHGTRAKRWGGAAPLLRGA